MGNKIQIEIASDTDYENLIANIYIEGLFVGLVHQETDVPIFEIPSEEKTIGRVFSVEADLMIEAIDRAKRELVQSDS